MNSELKSRPTLRGRIVLQIGVMVICSLLIGIGAIAGIEGLHQDMGVTVQGYRELRQIYEVGFELARAKDALSSDVLDVHKAQEALETAELKLNPDDDQDSGKQRVVWLDETARDQCRMPIVQAICELKSLSSSSLALAAVDDGLGKLAMLSGQIRLTLAEREERAAAQRHRTLLLIAGLSGALVIVAVFVGTRQYRGVVKPLDRLGWGVRRFAAGNLSERIVPEADREFAALAEDFNRMAGELESLCRGLEEKVEEKSRELSRSQRLASVGFLAAGVAHEINNPLSIITGYGERSLRLLDRPIDETSLDKTRKTMRIICEEAFRCKEITERLLSLARPGTESRKRVAVGPIVEQVVRDVGGLGGVASRRFYFEMDRSEDLNIVANEGEIRQVAMNLLLNALEAGGEKIDVRVSRVEDEIELSVADDGSGMTAATLERIFEPFYTEKRGEKPGIGLGLSITHAIVERHGGRIRADSEGLKHGSRVVVRFPAAREGVLA